MQATVYQPESGKLEGGCGGDREEGEGGWLRFQPMRLLLTGSSCLEKSPLWSFGPQGGCTTSMGEHSFGCRRDRETGRNERETKRAREREDDKQRERKGEADSF